MSGLTEQAAEAVLRELRAARENERLWREKAEANRLLVAERDSEIARLRHAAQAVVTTLEIGAEWVRGHPTLPGALSVLRAALASPASEEER